MAAVVVVIIAVAGIGAYFGLAASNSNAPNSTSLISTASSSTPSTSTTSSTSSSAFSSTSTTSNPTSSTQTTSSSSSASTSTVSTACTTSTASTQPASVIIPLLSAYSAITQTFQGTLNGTASTFTATYNVVYVSSTTYKVDITDVTPAKTYSTTAWLLKDGTVVGLVINGHNFNASASTSFQNYFGNWELELEYGLQITSSASYSYFHSTGTATVTAVPSTFTVTNYVANSLPETISLCNGESLALTSGSFSVGTPTGSSYPLITYIQAAGSRAVPGSTVAFSFTAQMTSVTAA